MSDAGGIQDALAATSDFLLLHFVVILAFFIQLGVSS